MTVFEDPLHPRQRRMFCSYCWSGGDPLSVLGRASELEDPWDWLQLAADRGLLPEDRTSGAEAEEYVKSAEMEAATTQRWDVLRMNPTVYPNAEVNRILQVAGLWGGWANGWRETMARVMGAGTRREINSLFGAQVLPRGFSAVMVVAWHNAPGRICGLGFLGDSGLRYLGTGMSNEGGLAMLNAAAGQPVVWAVPNLADALRLQRLAACDRDPAPVVCYGESTRETWKTLAGSEIVLWDPEGSPDTWKQARRIGDSSRVCTVPGRAGSQDDPLPALDVSLERVRSRSHPWPSALGRFLADPDRTPARVRAVMRELQLTVRERRRVMEECPAEMRPKLGRLLDMAGADLTASVGASEVRLTRSGWSAGPEGRASTICDCPFTVSREIVSPTGMTWWEGEIRTPYGQPLPYWASETLVRHDSLSWLTARVMQAGRPAPEVAPVWARRLADCAAALSAPEREAAEGPVRIRSDGEIVFPGFTLRNGEPRPLPAFCAGSEVPGTAVQSPVTRGRDHRDRPGPESAAAAVLGVLMVRGLLASDRGGQALPVLVCGGPGSVGEAVLTDFVRTAGVPRIDAADLADPARRRRGWPVVCNDRGGRWPDAWNGLPDSDVWIAVTPLEAACLAVGRGGQLVDGRTDAVSADGHPPSADAIAWLADLQARRFPVEAGVVALLEDFCRWRTRTFGDRGSDMAAACLAAVPPPPSPGQALIALFREMASSGNLRTTRNASPAEAAGRIVLDEGSGCVRLPRQALAAAVRRLRLPPPDLIAAHADLTAGGLLVRPDPDGEHWIIESSRWEAARRAGR